jgi:uncharacterized membrane protein YdbT with pleckstrin-like domain
LGERERIILATRQHWFVLVREIVVEVILTLAVLVLVTLMWLGLGQPLVTLGYLILILPLISMLRDVMGWLNHRYIVTNRRVMQVFGVFSKNVTDSSLEKVNDVKMEQSVLGRLFDYGDIEILTASEFGINRLTKIGNPIRFKTAMLNARENLARDQREEEARLDGEIPAMIRELDALRREGALSEEEFERKKAELLSRL